MKEERIEGKTEAGERESRSLRTSEGIWSRVLGSDGCCLEEGDEEEERDLGRRREGERDVRVDEWILLTALRSHV